MTPDEARNMISQLYCSCYLTWREKMAALKRVQKRKAKLEASQ